MERMRRKEYNKDVRWGSYRDRQSMEAGDKNAQNNEWSVRSGAVKIRNRRAGVMVSAEDTITSKRGAKGVEAQQCRRSCFALLTCSDSFLSTLRTHIMSLS